MCYRLGTGSSSAAIYSGRVRSALAGSSMSSLSALPANPGTSLSVGLVPVSVYVPPSATAF